MAETVTTPIPIPESSPSPGSEIGYDGGTSRGLKVIGDCINTLIATKHPICIHDMLIPSERALTTSDPFHLGGTYREWKIKTSSHLGITTATNRQYTLQVYLAKTSGSHQYRVYVDGATAGTFTTTSSVLTPQWVNLTTTLAIADTAESVRVGLGLITYNGGAAASNYVYAVRLVPNLWTIISNQNNAWTHPVTTNKIAPVPNSFITDWSGAHSYYIQCMQDCVQYLWQHRTGNLYQSAWYGDYSGNTTLSSVTKIRVKAPFGISIVRVSFKVKRTTVNGAVGVLTDSYTDSVASPSSTSWVFIDVPVIENAPINMFIQAKETFIYGVSVYCVDPAY